MEEEIKKRIIHLIFPKRCPVCRHILQSESENICEDCRKVLPYIRAPFCAKCGRSLPGRRQAEPAEADPAGKQAAEMQGTGYQRGDQELLCSTCSKYERAFVRNRCVFDYDEIMSRIMVDIKYNSKKEYMEFCAEEAARALGSYIRATGAQCIVPVPVHEERLRRRGYNQAAILAQHIAGSSGLPYVELLERRRQTKVMKELGASDRQTNMAGAISTPFSQGLPQRVLVADDIYTTGSTMDACARALLEAGVKEVYGLCVCAGEDAFRESRDASDGNG